MKLLKATLLSASLIVGLAFAAQADDRVTPSFGNTIKIENSGGTVLYYFNEDGSFSTNTGINGTWEMRGDDFCTMVDGADFNCGRIDGPHAVGETWQLTGPDGEVSTLTLIAGR